MSTDRDLYLNASAWQKVKALAVVGMRPRHEGAIDADQILWNEGTSREHACLRYDNALLSPGWSCLVTDTVDKVISQL